MKKFLTKTVIAGIVATFLVATPVTAANAATCVSANYPPSCTPVGMSTPEPVYVPGQSVTNPECDAYAWLYDGALSAVPYTCAYDPVAHMVSITVPSSVTGSEPVVVRYSTTIPLNGQSVVANRSGEVTFQTDKYFALTRSAIYVLSSLSQLGAFTVDSAQRVLDKFTVPAATPLGKNYIEFVGYLSGGRRLAIAIPVQVQEVVVPAMNHQRRSSIAFSNKSVSLNSAGKTKLNRLLALVPAGATNVRVTARAYFWGGRSTSISRGNKVLSYMKQRLTGATFGRPSPRHVSNGSLLRNIVDVTITWTK